MSWKPQVKVVNDPKWYDNALRFETEQEASDSARDLSWRWTSVVEHRAIESDDPVTHSYIGGALADARFAQILGLNDPN